MLSHKPWRLEAVLRLGIALFVSLLAGFAVIQLAVFFFGPSKPEDSEHFQMRAGMLISILSFQGAAIVFSGLFFREHAVRWYEALGCRSTGLKHSLLLGILVGEAALPVTWVLAEASNRLMQSRGLEPSPQLAVQTLQAPMPGWMLTILGVATIILAPLAEEILFRGILYPVVKQLGFPKLALWGTSFMFALIHFDLPTMLPLFCLSVFLILLYEWTDNLLAPIIAHSVFNAANLALLKWGTS